MAGILLDGLRETMWTRLKNNIAIVPKAYDVRANNVLVLETNKLYFFVPLQDLEGSPVGDYCGSSAFTEDYHPLAAFEAYKDTDNKYHQFMIVDGERRDEWLCCICKHRFMGLTGGCKWKLIMDNADERPCSPEFDRKPDPPVLQVKGGIYVPPKYFNANFRRYYRDRALGDYDFNVDVVDMVLKVQSPK